MRRYLVPAASIGYLAFAAMDTGCSGTGSRQSPDGAVDTTARRGLLHGTGNMTVARRLHTATLLLDGKVLVAGGIGHAGGDPSGILRSAEIYDPSSGEFSATGSMIEARYTHTATLLSNGIVLVAGGTGTNSNLASSELYDPASGAFLPAASMSTARAAHTATLLSDGMVLIAGGWPGGTADLSSAETYDPATGAFIATGNMTVPRSSYSATLLPNGKVLLTGQYISASTEVYDPATRGFTASNDMVVARSAHTATLLLNGSVLVAGGVGLPAVTLTTAELFAPVTGGFSMTGSMTTARSYATATLLADGKVLIAGGEANTDLVTNFLASTELYDPTSATFVPAEDMAAPRCGHTATLLSNGEVLFTGGGDDVDKERSSAELYP